MTNAGARCSGVGAAWRIPGSSDARRTAPGTSRAADPLDEAGLGVGSPRRDRSIRVLPREMPEVVNQTAAAHDPDAFGAERAEVRPELDHPLPVGASAGSESSTTGTSASGKRKRSGIHAPWSRPRAGLSVAWRPLSRTRAATRAASAGLARSGVAEPVELGVEATEVVHRLGVLGGGHRSAPGRSGSGPRRRPGRAAAGPERPRCGGQGRSPRDRGRSSASHGR